MLNMYDFTNNMMTHNNSLHQTRHDLQVYGMIKSITSMTALTRDELAGELKTVVLTGNDKSFLLVTLLSIT